MHSYLGSKLTRATAIVLFHCISALPAHAITFAEPAGEKSVEKAKELPKLLDRFSPPIPEGHKPIYGVSGDLNFDGRDDLSLVTRQEGKDEIWHLLIFFQDESGRLEQVFDATDILAKDFEQPYNTLGFTGIPEISNKVLTLTFEFTGKSAAEYTIYKFRWDKAKEEFKTIGFTAHWEECANMMGDCGPDETVDMNFSTKKMIRDNSTCRIPQDFAIPSLRDFKPINVDTLPRCHKGAQSK